ncbi:MAG: phosphate transport system regulatory protein [Actinomycetota bacterium]
MNRAAHDELLSLRAEVLDLAAILIASVPRATQILLDQDLEGAEYQILSDDEMDARTIELEERCISFMALHAPVASELRHAVAIMKMAADIERSSDLVKNICKVARRIHGFPLDSSLRKLIVAMSQQAQLLLQQSLTAYEDYDLPTANSVRDMDMHLDSLHKQFIQSIFEAHGNKVIDLPVAVQMAITARFYERIGDHAVNIAEFIRFFLTGEKPVFSDLRRPTNEAGIIDEVGGIRV